MESQKADLISQIMKEKNNSFKCSGFLRIICITIPILFWASMVMNAQTKGDEFVKLVRMDNQQKVDVIIGDNLFTSYRYPGDIEKPFLFPVIAPDGNIITRGYPIEPRKGERIDHPHHIGIWFNYGDINGLDFWNNSYAIPVDKKDLYGHIVHQKIIRAESGSKGILEVLTKWEDNKGNVLLTEDAKYIFSGDRNSRTIDHISTLTAVNGPVTFGDSKEGMFAIRVDRAFEMPSNESLIFTDAKGNPTTVKATDNTGVTGMYYSSSGQKGDDVWGTRNKWVVLAGEKNNDTVSIAIFDHPKNNGFPAFAHARGYGLFALNDLGQNSYDPGLKKKSTGLEKGESITMYHRFYVQSGSELTPAEAEDIFNEFTKSY
jgi:hypothetical protein